MDIIELVSEHGRARIARQGAQVLDAELGGVPLLWLSPLAAFEPGRAVRGGVPVCFPWFGKHPAGLPAHGFARNRDWTVLAQDGRHARFELCDDEAGRALWPHRFRAELAVTLEDAALRFDFAVENRDDAPIEFTYALHSYFAVDDVRACRVEGLEGRLRREVGHVTMPQQGVVALAEPIDAVFEIAPDPLTLADGERRVLIEADGMRSAVVWNIGPDNGQADIGPHWPRYACVERGNVGAAAVRLAAGETHRAGMRLSRSSATRSNGH